MALDRARSERDVFDAAYSAAERRTVDLREGLTRLQRALTDATGLAPEYSL